MKFLENSSYCLASVGAMKTRKPIPSFLSYPKSFPNSLI